MSIWTHIEGKVYISKHAHVSMRDMIAQYLTNDEIIVKLESSPWNKHQERIAHTFDISWCNDGLHAAQKIDELAKALREKDAYAIIDLTATIRFVG